MTSSKNSVWHKSQWIDISVHLNNAMAHWPGDPPFNIKRIKDMDAGDNANLSVVSMGAHSGTHIDAPVHFVRNGRGIDEMPLNTMVGRARVIEIKDSESIKYEELVKRRIRRGERILFKTRNSLNRIWESNHFVEDFIYVSDEAANFLAGKGVKLVGVDYLSVGSYKLGGRQVHESLLSNGVWIIEGLDLSQVTPGKYHLVCLPLRLMQGDGSPARAMIRPL